MTIDRYRTQLERCTGPAPKPREKPKPLTDIERERLAELEAIQVEYSETFKEK